jgi:D-threo-aldose 1-dehydrogenase
MQVPKLGMGCAPVGELFAKLSEAESLETFRAAYEAGIRLLDTAPWYGTGRSELRVGAGLRDLEDVQVLTKVGRVLRRGTNLEAARTWKGGLPFEVHFTYTRDGVMRSFEDSLQRLGRARLAGLAVHDLDLVYHSTWAAVEARFAELERGGYDAMLELKAAGDVKWVGAGINRVGMIPEFLKRFTLDYFIVAMPYTLLSQEGLEELNECARRGVSVIIGAPFASGLLASGAKQPATYNYEPAKAAMVDKAARMEAACERHGVTLAAAALQFLFAHPAVVSAIPGFLNGAQARSAVEYLEHRIPEMFWEELRSEGLIEGAAPMPEK